MRQGGSKKKGGGVIKERKRTLSFFYRTDIGLLD